MAAMSGRLCGHYPDLATRGRGHSHSDFAGIFAAARGGWMKRVFLFDQTSEHLAPTRTALLWPGSVRTAAEVPCCCHGSICGGRVRRS